MELPNAFDLLKVPIRAMHLKDMALIMNVMKFVVSQTILVHYDCHLPFKYTINFVTVI